MRDYTHISEQDNGKYLIQREISQEVKFNNLEQQLKKLHHTKEQLEDQLEGVNLRIEIIEKALEEGEAEGNTALTNLGSSPI